MKVVWVPFGEVMTLQRRKIAVDVDATYREIGVRSFGRGLFVKDPIPGVALGDKRVFRVAGDDVVISNVFAWEGAVGIAGPEHSGLVGSHRFMTWTPHDLAAVVPQYVVHYLSSDRGVEALAAASPGSAGRNRTLSVRNLEKILVPLLSLTDQRRIAAHLGRAGETARVAHDRERRRRMKARFLEPRLATAGRRKLRSLLRPVQSVEIDASAQYDIAGVYSFGRGLLRRPSIYGEQTKYTSMTPLRRGLVVYSKLGAFEGAVTVVDERFEGTWVSPEFPVFAVQDRVSPAYLRHYLTGLEFQQQLSAVTTGVGARQKRVSPTAFLELDIPLPEPDEQQEYVRLADLLETSFTLKDRRFELSEALLPAARNEIFGAMR